MPLRRLLLTFAAVWAVPTVAQLVPADTLAERVLPDVTVTAARTPVSTAEAPAAVTVLGREEADAIGATSVADVLEARSGVFVKRYGPSGLASLSIRGTSASQTAVLLDGHRLSDPQLGQMDAALLPSILFERVEVASGPSSALYGTDAVGGVVHLQTHPGGRRFRVRTDAGAFGERSVGVVAQDERAVSGEARMSAVVATEHARSRGDYRYADPLRVGSWVRRNGADEQRTSLLTRMRLEDETRSAAVGLWAGSAERGLVGLSGQPARQWDDHLRLWADGHARIGGVRLTLQGFHQRASLRYESRAVTDQGDTRVWSGEARATLPLPTTRPLRGVWTLTAGTALAHAAADHTGLVDSSAAALSAAAFVSATADYGRVRLFPALRVDRTAFGSAVAPSLGLNVQPLAWPALRLKARLADAFRAPTLNDRFWGEEGTPGIRPERGWTAEAGAVLVLGTPAARLNVEATVFTSRLRDQIVWAPRDGGPWRPANVGRVESAGYEVSLDAAAGHEGRLLAEVGGLVAVQRARDRTDPTASAFGQALLYTPDLQTKAYAALGIGPVRLDAGLQHAGHRLVTYGNEQAAPILLPPYTVLGVGARLRLRLPRGAALTLGARLENVTDHQYQVITGYPMPPRHLRFSLTFTS